MAAKQGMILLPVLFGGRAATGWPGQFNLDFLCMLVLFGLWVAWRHRFSGLRIASAPAGRPRAGRRPPGAT